LCSDAHRHWFFNFLHLEEHLRLYF
jgi:hypothetical protein